MRRLSAYPAGNPASAASRGRQRPVAWDSLSGRVILEARPIQLLDAWDRSTWQAEAYADEARHVGWGTNVAVPLLSRGVAIGTLSIGRREVHEFADRDVALLGTFADQAVIAIENARLFQELQTRVSELQALGEVGQAVSWSLDPQEVLTTIVSHATGLAQADGGTIFELDEAAGEFVHRASYRLPEELFETIDRNCPRLDSDTAAGRAARSGVAIQVPDILDAPDAAMPLTLDLLRSAGFRALIFVPLVREQRVVGMLVIRRKEPGEFPEAVVDLLQTLASQSVLAIENARLYQQVEETSRKLQIASQPKSEFLANMSYELRTPPNAVIGYSEMLQEEAEDTGDEVYVPDLQRINVAGKPRATACGPSRLPGPSGSPGPPLG
jgi:GAF domain-containing protein